MVGADYNVNSGWMYSIQNGLDSPPTTGWYYYNGEEWSSDDTSLVFIWVHHFLKDGSRPEGARRRVEVVDNKVLPIGKDSSSTERRRHHQ